MNRLALFLIALLCTHGTACGIPSDRPTVAASSTAPEGTAPAAQPPGGRTEAPGPAQPEPPADRGAIVARVNGTPIYKLDFDRAVELFMQNNQIGPDAGEQKKQEIHKEVLDGLIGSELLFQQAKSIPIEIPQAEVDRTVAQYKQATSEEGFNAELQRRSMTVKNLENLVRQNLMVHKMIQERVIDAVQVPDTEMEKFYDEHLDLMQKPEDVEASHILVRSTPSDAPEKKAEARRKIDEALGRIKAGEEFSDTARKYSDDASASQGGALGTIRRGQTVPAFEDVAFKLAVGQVSEVFESQFGFHVVKVTGKHPPGAASFDEAKGRIADYLKQRKSQEAIEKMVDSLRAGAKIEIL